MNRRFYTNLGIIGLSLFLLLSATFYSRESNKAASYGNKTKELIEIVENNADFKKILEKSIQQAKEINPDKTTNPAQTLEQYYEFINIAEKSMPWEFIQQGEYVSLYDKIDQSLCYFYFINDQPIADLKDKGYYNNSIQYVEPYSSWMISFNKSWGQFLDSDSSWNDKYYQMALKDKKFGLHNDWYESPSKWKTFNQFFARYLKSPDKRPIAKINDNSVVISPADAVPQGIWKIDSNSNIVAKEGVPIKSATLNSIKKLIGEDSPYSDKFANGTFTHTYLDVNDYHRYHFPLSGTIKEIKIIPGENAAGCIVEWDRKNKRYVYDASIPGWQTIEARGCVILETEKHGLVALLPIGMSQVCSINFEKEIKVGKKVNKGDMLGYFLFGGSDFIMIFQQDAGFVLDQSITNGQGFKHLLMGEKYGILKGKK
jgi:phosphatidylserine decarboxylase precursor